MSTEPSSEARQVAVVTGASGGIGADLARVLAAHGHDLALVARSADRLESLADEIVQAGAARRPLVFALDLSEPGAADRLAADLAAAQAQVVILVNNAAFGLGGEVAALDRVEQVSILDLNVKALTDLTLCFLPEIKAARGRILNVASTAAFFPGPGMAIYYATKAYVLSFSEALSQELKRFNVTVTALCPGPTETGFAVRARLDAALFEVMRPMASRPVAEIGYRGMMAGRRVVITGITNKLAVRVAAVTPRRLLLPVLALLQRQRRI